MFQEYLQWNDGVVMLPDIWLARTRNIITIYPRQLYHCRRFATHTEGGASDDELRLARQWLATFNIGTIPKNIGDISFSRSSGPGGQNVNKVNSKATLKVPLPSVLRIVPSIIHPAIRQSRYCNSASEAITIQSDGSRKQSDNVHSCFVKLHDLIADAGAKSVPGETSRAQKELVQSFQKAADRHRLAAKKQHSSKKSSRKGSTSTSY